MTINSDGNFDLNNPVLLAQVLTVDYDLTLKRGEKTKTIFVFGMHAAF